MPWRSAFSTLGCSRLPVAEVVALACEGNWDGVELRAAPDEPVNVGLSPHERAGVRRLLADAGLKALSVASYVEVDDPSLADDDVVAALIAHAELARDLDARFVRVFPGGPSRDDASVRRLSAAAPFVGDVTLALETHDSCPRGADVARVLEQVAHPRVGAVWDVQHPWRAGERLADTYRLLEAHLAYVQITDARGFDDATPALPGTGVLPLQEVRNVLVGAGYDGWVSLEWASYWFPDAPPLTEALPCGRRWFDGTLWG